MDRKQEQAASTYWQEDEKGNFTLRHEGEDAAAVYPHCNSITIRLTEDYFADHFLPDYICPFAEAERQLSVQRVDEIRACDGTLDPDVRRNTEHEAGIAAETHTPAQWVKVYASQALHFLDLNGVDREVTDREKEGRYHLTEALAAMDGDDPAAIREHIKEASMQLPVGKEFKRHGDPWMEARKACAVIEYEDSQRGGRAVPWINFLRPGDSPTPQHLPVLEAGADRADWLSQAFVQERG